MKEKIINIPDLKIKLLSNSLNSLREAYNVLCEQSRNFTALGEYKSRYNWFLEEKNKLLLELINEVANDIKLKIANLKDDETIEAEIAEAEADFEAEQNVR